jgi:succinate--hydroxymethylglutarate CoA-transferase
MIATADVIKVYCRVFGFTNGQIESPLKGDDTRSWLPPFAPLSTDSTVPRPDLPPESAYFLQANRNKRS